jgi:hypothetical protein
VILCFFEIGFVLHTNSSLVARDSSPVTRQPTWRTRVARDSSLVFGWRDGRFWTLDARFSILDTRCWILVSGGMGDSRFLILDAWTYRVGLVDFTLIPASGGQVRYKCHRATHEGPQTGAHYTRFWGKSQQERGKNAAWSVQRRADRGLHCEARSFGLVRLGSAALTTGCSGRVLWFWRNHKAGIFIDGEELLNDY